MKAHRKIIYFDNLIPEMLTFMKDNGGWIELYQVGSYMLHAFDEQTILAFGLKFGFGTQRTFAHSPEFRWK